MLPGQESKLLRVQVLSFEGTRMQRTVLVLQLEPCTWCRLEHTVFEQRLPIFEGWSVDTNSSREEVNRTHNV